MHHRRCLKLPYLSAIFGDPVRTLVYTLCNSNLLVAHKLFLGTWRNAIGLARLLVRFSTSVAPVATSFFPLLSLPLSLPLQLRGPLCGNLSNDLCNDLFD